MTNEEAIKAIKANYPSGGYERLCEALDMAIKSLDERKTGRWIVLDECANSGCYCSNCRKKLVKEGWSNTVKKIKFCPNCGAKMERAEELEDETHGDA